jgi:hypothetical protein
VAKLVSYQSRAGDVLTTFNCESTSICGRTFVYVLLLINDSGDLLASSVSASKESLASENY